MRDSEPSPSRSFLLVGSGTSSGSIPAMPSVLSQKCQVALPTTVRKELRLSAGCEFEVSIEDDHTITLRRISQPANRGLVDLLLNCQASFEGLSGNPPGFGKEPLFGERDDSWQFVATPGRGTGPTRHCATEDTRRR